MRKFIVTMALITMASLLLPTVSSAEYAVKNIGVVASAGSAPISSDLYGDYLVYCDSNTFSIFLKNLTSGDMLNLGQGIYPVIYGNKIVYFSFGGGLKVYDINTAQTTAITATAGFPIDMYGSYVLLGQQGGNTLRLLDINTEEIVEISNIFPAVNFGIGTTAVINGSKVAYMDTSNNLHLYDIAARVDAIIKSGIDSGKLDLDQDRVVYIANSLINIYNLTTQQETQIDSTIEDPYYHYLISSPAVYLGLRGNKLICGVTDLAYDFYFNVVIDLHDSTKTVISRQPREGNSRYNLDGNNFIYWAPNTHEPSLDGLSGFVLAQLWYIPNLSLELIGGPNFEVGQAFPFSEAQPDPITGKPITVWFKLTNNGIEDFNGFVGSYAGNYIVRDRDGNIYPSGQSPDFGWVVGASGSYLWQFNPEHLRCNTQGQQMTRYLSLPAGHSINYDIIYKYYPLYRFGSGEGVPYTWEAASIGDNVTFQNPTISFNNDIENRNEVLDRSVASNDSFTITVVEPMPDSAYPLGRCPNRLTDTIFFHSSGGVNILNPDRTKRIPFFGVGLNMSNSDFVFFGEYFYVRTEESGVYKLLKLDDKANATEVLVTDHIFNNFAINSQGEIFIGRYLRTVIDGTPHDEHFSIEKVNFGGTIEEIYRENLTALGRDASFLGDMHFDPNGNLIATVTYRYNTRHNIGTEVIRVSPSGQRSVLLAGLSGPMNNTYEGFDDFIFDLSGNIYVLVHQTNPTHNYIMKVTSDGQRSVFFDALPISYNSRLAFDKNWNLYVTYFPGGSVKLAKLSPTGETIDDDVTEQAYGGMTSFEFAPSTFGNDSDLDCVFDFLDNCVLVKNPLNEDSDRDGYGNACDGDFDNNFVVNNDDLDIFKLHFPSQSGGANYDSQIDCTLNGFIDASDLSCFAAQLGLGMPGLSGLYCAGSVSCPRPTTLQCSPPPEGLGVPGSADRNCAGTVPSSESEILESPRIKNQDRSDVTMSD